MRLARGKRGRPVAAADAAMAEAADTVAVVKVAVREEVINSESICERASSQIADRDRRNWAGLDSNQRRRKASRFTVCPVWPLRYLPVSVADSYRLVPCSLQLAAASSLKSDAQRVAVQKPSGEIYVVFGW